jgi:cytochrome c553
MALPIRELPVLEGKNAQYFYEKLAEAKENKSKEEVQESYRSFKIWWEEQERLHPRTLW